MNEQIDLAAVRRALDVVRRNAAPDAHPVHVLDAIEAAIMAESVNRTEGRFDPLLAPGLLQLIGPYRAVALIGTSLGPGSNGCVGWHYDPRNRVFTPAIWPHASVAEGLWHMTVRLMDQEDVRPVLREALALAQAEYERDEKRREKKL